MTKIEAATVERKIPLNNKLKWTITNHKSIPKLIKWIKDMDNCIIINQDRKSVTAVYPHTLDIIIWRIKK